MLLLLAVLLPAATYVLLSLASFQNKLRDIASGELSQLLGAEVVIGRLSLHPFSRLSVHDLNLVVESDTVAKISTVSAGFSPWRLLTKGDLIVNYALIDSFDIALNRATPDAPLNIQPVIDKLKSKEPKKEPSKFQLEINTVRLRRGTIRYDVLSASAAEAGLFNPNHIAVTDLSLNANMPTLSGEDVVVELKHLAFKERSGFELSELKTDFELDSHQISLANFEVSLPNTHLALADLSLEIDSTKNIGKAFVKEGLTVSLKSGSDVYLPDLQAFVPRLSSVKQALALNFTAHATTKNIDINHFFIRTKHSDAAILALHGSIDNYKHADSLRFRLTDSELSVNGNELANMIGAFIPGSVSTTMSRVPRLNLELEGEGSLKEGSIALSANGTPGTLALNADYKRSRQNNSVSADLTLKNFNVALFVPTAKVGVVNASLSGEAVFDKKLQSGNLQAEIANIDFNDHIFHDAHLNFDMPDKERAELNFRLDDEAGHVKLFALYGLVDSVKQMQVAANLDRVDLNQLGIKTPYPEHKLSSKLLVDIASLDPAAIEGKIEVSDFDWVNASRQGLHISKFVASASPEQISVESPVISGKLNGRYDFSTIIPDFKRVLARIMPALVDVPTATDPQRYNDFKFDFNIAECEDVCTFFKLPYTVLYEATVKGRFDSRTDCASAEISAPYLGKGDNVIEKSLLIADLNPTASKLTVTTQKPSKKGNMGLEAFFAAADNKLDTRLQWRLQSERPIDGSFALHAELYSTEHQEGDRFPCHAKIDLLPGTLNFGSDTWQIPSSSIIITPKKIIVDKLAANAPNQNIAINGTIGNESSDVISIALNNFRLLPIFETLDISAVMIGGKASGLFTAKNILSNNPFLRCPHLMVDSISYNGCALGNADIDASWNPGIEAFTLDAAVTGFENKKSRIDAKIYPIAKGIDLKFYVDSVPLGFLNQFLSSFSSDIGGRGSGYARVFGPFSGINLEGDVYAEDFRMKINYTNATYYVTDSIHFRPGLISMDNLLIRDYMGHTARLNGYLKHDCFRNAVFNFDITQAKNILGLNTNPSINPDWYGHIFGTGEAHISGHPGVVNIGVDMTTGPQSTFTFVLSNRRNAADYSFLRFNDATPDSLRTPATPSIYPPSVLKLKEKGSRKAEESSSECNVDLTINVTPEADVNILMNPVTGDNIKGKGSGTMNLDYRSANNDLAIRGSCRLLEGNFRFTLQDIIIKDFTIEEGSTIKFDGDPNAINTDIRAYYATNATLTDLDESFLQDKDVARTNVPVHALLLVNGDIRQPAIKFDLAFPTLPDETYRKVRSIVSTEDMMNRQIIYLLALNRFYTPDYMTNATKGNELFSVASSTISSQLGNMLGKLSDKWSIAPNLRSDRGDFSDLEVDVALSSRLLNNRLLLNGNFGYRDKTLNSNQFVGDFDIEYLLNKPGTWRLKAYNRYNDRNYYLRTAQTTQGVGLMLRKDFDSFFVNKKESKNDSIK